MITPRRRFLLAAALAPALSTAWAQERAPVEGTDYRDVKPPQPVDTGNKIEVLEFFWYGCPHCATFEPDLDAWRKKLPADVEYRRLPVAFDDARSVHTKIYYALELLKRTDDLHEKVFHAMHVNKMRMTDSNEIADFMAANGIDRKAWLNAFNSFSVAAQTKRAAQVWRAYKIDGTPSVGIDGRWLTAPSMAGTRARALQVMDYLVARARTDRGRK